MSKLAALLNMLSSEFDGERANAARMIATMAKKEGKTVADFVMTGGERIIYRDRIVEKTVYRDRPPKYDDEDLRRYRPHPGARKPPPGEGSATDLLQGLYWAKDFPEHLNGFETEFIASVLSTCFDDTDLSYKQEKVARRIIAKVRACEGEPLI